MFLLQVTRRGEIRALTWEPFPMGHLILDDNYQIWNRQFLIPLGVTVAAYGLISTHLWGTGHIGAATQQQQVKNKNENKQNNNGKITEVYQLFSTTTGGVLQQQTKWNLSKKKEIQTRVPIQNILLDLGATACLSTPNNPNAWSRCCSLCRLLASTQHVMEHWSSSPIIIFDFSIWSLNVVFVSWLLVKASKMMI